MSIDTIIGYSGMFLIAVIVLLLGLAEIKRKG